MKKTFLIAAIIALVLSAVILSTLAPFSVYAQTNYTRMLSGVNYQRGTSYSLLSADTTRVTAFVNASPIAVCLSSPSSLCAGVPAGSGQFFGAGSDFSVYDQGAGAATITCSGCTINLAATLVLTAGQSADIYGDGTNFIAITGGAEGAPFCRRPESSALPPSLSYSAP